MWGESGCKNAFPLLVSPTRCYSNHTGIVKSLPTIEESGTVVTTTRFLVGYGYATIVLTMGPFILFCIHAQQATRAQTHFHHPCCCAYQFCFLTKYMRSLVSNFSFTHTTFPPQRRIRICSRKRSRNLPWDYSVKTARASPNHAVAHRHHHREEGDCRPGSDLGQLCYPHQHRRGEYIYPFSPFFLGERDPTCRPLPFDLPPSPPSPPPHAPGMFIHLLQAWRALNASSSLCGRAQYS